MFAFNSDNTYTINRTSGKQTTKYVTYIYLFFFSIASLSSPFRICLLADLYTIRHCSTVFGWLLIFTLQQHRIYVCWVRISLRQPSSFDFYLQWSHNKPYWYTHTHAIHATLVENETSVATETYWIHIKHTSNETKRIEWEKTSIF